MTEKRDWKRWWLPHQTADGFRYVARRLLQPLEDQTTGQPVGPLRRAKTALFDKPVNAAIDSVVYGPRASRANMELGQALSSTGPARDGLVRLLMQQTTGRARNNRTAKALSQMVELLTRAGGAAASSALIQD